MRQLGKLDRILMMVLIIILPFIIYLFSFSTQVYNNDFYNSLFIKTNVDQKKAQQLTQDLFAYFKNNDYSVPKIKMLDKNENLHIKDVKVLMRNALFAFYLLVIIFFAGIFFAREKNKIFFYGGILSALFPVFLLVSFTTSFTLFHKIFFPQGNWVFPATATLVNVYTFDFFKLFVQEIFLRGELFSLGLSILSFLSRKR